MVNGVLLKSVHTSCHPQLGWGWGAADTKIPSAENPQLSKVLSVKPAVGQNVALHALPTVKNS